MEPARGTSIVIAVLGPHVREGRRPGVHIVVVDDPARSALRLDVGEISEPDEVTLDVLARLQLAARRRGGTIELENARTTLVDLLALAGLSDVLPLAPGSAVELDGQTEDREQLLLDEEVDRDDPPA